MSVYVNHQTTCLEGRRIFQGEWKENSNLGCSIRRAMVTAHGDPESPTGYRHWIHSAAGPHVVAPEHQAACESRVDHESGGCTPGGCTPKGGY